MIADLAIIILNYRTVELTAECLASLEHEIQPGMQVLVVDNSSGDGSAEELDRTIRDREWTTWARVLRAPTNGGFAAGNNLGIQAVDAFAYVLLNSDTLVRPGALQALKDAMRARPDAGVIGSGLLDARGAPDPSFFRATAPASELIRGANTGVITRMFRRFDPALPATEEPLEPDWVGFACVLIRRAVIDSVGLLDDGYFMYFEDVDYCRRARAAGWKILYWPHGKVIHLQGGSSRLSAAGGLRQRAPRFYYEARARYFAKFYGRGGLWLANCLWHLGRMVALPRELAGRPPSCREREALDIWINATSPLRARPDRPS
jgi:GT2 family glycosyltransferase